MYAQCGRPPPKQTKSKTSASEMKKNLRAQEQGKGSAQWGRMGEGQPPAAPQPRGLARFGIRRVPAADRGAAEGPQPGDRQSGDLLAPPPRPRGLARFGIRVVPEAPAALGEGGAPQRGFHARLASLDTLRFQPTNGDAVDTAGPSDDQRHCCTELWLTTAASFLDPRSGGRKRAVWEHALSRAWRRRDHHERTGRGPGIRII